MSTTSPERTKSAPSRILQITGALTIAIATVLYVVCVCLGRIPQANRLTTAEFGILVVGAFATAVILRPDFLSAVEKVDVLGIKAEFGQVKRSQIEVQKQQQEQAAVLEDIRLALRLLIKEAERGHLINLFERKTDKYQVGGSLRDEIRHLRAMKLIEMCPGMTVGGMPGGKVFDLSKYVELTPDGSKFASRLIEHPEP